MPYYTAIVTLFAVAFYFFLATRVAVVRGKFNVNLVRDSPFRSSAKPTISPGQA